MCHSFPFEHSPTYPLRTSYLEPPFLPDTYVGLSSSLPKPKILPQKSTGTNPLPCVENIDASVCCVLIPIRRGNLSGLETGDGCRF